jgi:hypothetical protein
MKASHFLSTALLLFVQLAELTSEAEAQSSPGSNYSARNRNKHRAKIPKRSSMLTIDPSKILSTLILHGGLLIPKPMENDIAVLKKVLRCEWSEMNLVDKHLILYNLTVGLPGKRKALQIGRVYIHWDSFLKPCIEVQFDDVDITVEFTNLLLTRNNWNELQDFGFPPEFSSASNSEASGPHAFVRFESIDVNRNVTVRILSRPLQREIGNFSMDAAIADGLNTMIGNLSDENLARTGRRGCTSTELSGLLQKYFNREVRRFLSNGLNDIAANPGQAMRHADRLLNQASETIVTYAGDAGRKTGEGIHGAIVAKFDEMGLDIPADKVALWKKRSIDALNRLTEGQRNFGRK